MRPCFNCEAPMDGDIILRCLLCDISEVAESPSGYFNPVFHVKYADFKTSVQRASEKVFYIDHSAEHVPSPG